MYQKLYAAHIFVSFPLPPLKFGPAIERRQGKLVQKMKAHASESGQVHAQHPGVCGNGPIWRFRTRQTAATFSLSMHKYVRSPLFQDGVSGVHGIDTIYKNGGLLGEFFLTV
jgi:hypothetical protein